jgi:hypothetical protein
MFMVACDLRPDREVICALRGEPIYTKVYEQVVFGRMLE